MTDKTGWKLVPVEPTDEMVAAWPRFNKGAGHERDIYRAMLDAAPASPSPPPDSEQLALLKDAVEKLYYAAYWSPDRGCDAATLWSTVRDAAGLPAGQTYTRLGENRSPSPPPSAGVDAVAVKAFDLPNMLRDAFLAGRGLKDGDKLSDADQAAWADYDPERMNAYKRLVAALTPAPTPVEAGGEADMRRVCEALGFDPTNHHNAAKCPYCTLALAKPAPAVEAKLFEEALIGHFGTSTATTFTAREAGRQAAIVVRDLFKALAPAAQAGTVAQEGRR